MLGVFKRSFSLLVIQYNANPIMSNEIERYSYLSSRIACCEGTQNHSHEIAEEKSLLMT